jgi:hypothetical protein
MRLGFWIPICRLLIYKRRINGKCTPSRLSSTATEKNNLAAQHPDKVGALQQRLDELAKQSEKPLFLVDQFKVVIKGMHGKPILPTDEDLAGIETQ